MPLLMLNQMLTLFFARILVDKVLIALRITCYEIKSEAENCT